MKNDTERLVTDIKTAIFAQDYWHVLLVNYEFHLHTTKTPSPQASSIQIYLNIDPLSSYASQSCLVHLTKAADSRVLKWYHKNDLSEIMGFIRLFGTTYLIKAHSQKKKAI